MFKVKLILGLVPWAFNEGGYSHIYNNETNEWVWAIDLPYVGYSTGSSAYR